VPGWPACWEYDPFVRDGTSPFTRLAPLMTNRRYHATSLLLPSAKIMVSGGSTSLIEVYSPRYLFSKNDGPGPDPEAPRPVIGDAPQVVHYGRDFDVFLRGTHEITRATLVRPMAVTHQTDTEQRVVHLRIVARSGARVTLAAPDDEVAPYGVPIHALAPEGYYMLFVFDGKGVPSKAKFVRLVDAPKAGQATDSTRARVRATLATGRAKRKGSKAAEQRTSAKGGRTTRAPSRSGTPRRASKKERKAR
jgi:hypothetical protein